MIGEEGTKGRIALERARSRLNRKRSGGTKTRARGKRRGED